jgi:predicted acyltransferase
MSPSSHRFLAIDVLRGMTLALMIVVNMSISEEKSYGPLLHASWHGITLTDLVFPTFLFIVGAALSFTLDKYQRLGDAALLSKTFTRTALIFLSGYLLYWFPFFGFGESGQLVMLPLEKTRILGVLQRIALCYCAASLILHFGKHKGAAAFGIAALLSHWWVMATFGDYTLTGNAALKLDHLLLGEDHMYRGEGIPFDPEGLLGTLPSVVNVLAGYFAGRFIRERGSNFESIAKLLMVGVVCLAVALSWSGVFPLNKKLWTSSYVVCTIGVDLCVLAILVYLIDLRGLRNWTYFFEVFGKNTLFIYLLAEVLMSISWITHIGDQALFEWIYTNSFQWWAGDKNGSLLFAVAFMLGCWLIGYRMDKKRIYINF